MLYFNNMPGSGLANIKISDLASGSSRDKKAERRWSDKWPVITDPAKGDTSETLQNKLGNSDSLNIKE